MLLACAVALVVVVAVVVYYATLNQHYWEARGVPTLPPQWLFGNYKDIIFARKHLGIAFKDMYDAFPEADCVGYLKMRQPCLLLRHPDLIRSVLATNFSSFADNDVYVDRAVDPLFGHNPFVLKGEEWRRTRAHFLPAVSPARLRCYLPQVMSVCDALVRHVGVAAAAGSDIETRELGNKYTTDVVANAVFGVENDSFANPDNTFYNITTHLFNSDFLDHLKVMALLFFPQLAKYLKIRFVREEWERSMLTLVRQVMQHRRDTGETRNDLLQQMINSSLNDTDNVFTEEYIAAHCFSFMTDGTETSSNVLCFTLFELAWHEDVQEKLREEILEVVGTGETDITFEKINQLKYLDMVIMESLRLHPPAMSMHRVCTRRVTLPDTRVTLAPGTPVTLSVYGVHMDPTHYPDPRRFLPERFQPDLHAQRDKFTFLGFGEGPRICLGMKFATLQVKAGLVSLLRRFRVRPSPRSAYPPALDPNVFLKRPLNGAWLYFRPLEGAAHK